jgi:hypothetical protein
MMRVTCLLPLCTTALDFTPATPLLHSSALLHLALRLYWMQMHACQVALAGMMQEGSRGGDGCSPAAGMAAAHYMLGGTWPCAWWAVQSKSRHKLRDQKGASHVGLTTITQDAVQVLRHALKRTDAGWAHANETSGFPRVYTMQVCRKDAALGCTGMQGRGMQWVGVVKFGGGAFCGQSWGFRKELGWRSRGKPSVTDRHARGVGSLD